MAEQIATPSHSRNNSADTPAVRSFTTPIRPPPRESPATITTPPATGPDGAPLTPIAPTPLSTVTLVPTDTPSRAIGLPLTVPAAFTGNEDMVAGPWAKFMTEAPFQFSVGVNGVNLKGELLGRLLTMPAQNEPILRPEGHAGCSATTLFTKINASLANVEAFLMQCVGTVITDPEKMCEHCRKRNGPFSFCVKVEDIEECANCHWDRCSWRCSFNTNPITPKSRRSSKLYTQEEIQAMEKEAADLREKKADLVNKIIALRKLIEAAEAHRQQAFNDNPEHADDPLAGEELRQARDQYDQNLRNNWLWKMERKLKAVQTNFGTVADETMDLINRLEDLLP
ncbi:hypothetical protein N7454_003401 [Penicillium verhagenii]|nr:hypothetical protein N7454_003401 [Penicillium verhagenii]